MFNVKKKNKLRRLEKVEQSGIKNRRLGLPLFSVGSMDWISWIIGIIAGKKKL
jgi:hypothetical protein